MFCLFICQTITFTDRIPDFFQDLEDQIEVVTTARDDTLKAFKEFKQHSSDKLATYDEMKIKYDQLLSEKETTTQQLNVSIKCVRQYMFIVLSCKRIAMNTVNM